MLDVTHVHGCSPQLIIASDTLYTGNSEAFFTMVNPLLVREHPPKIMLLWGGMEYQTAEFDAARSWAPQST